MIQNIFKMKMRVNNKVRIVQRLDCKTIQLLIYTRKKVNNRVNIEVKQDFKTTIPRIKTRKRASNPSPKHRTEKTPKIKLPKSCKKKSPSVTILPRLIMKQTKQARMLKVYRKKT